MSRRGAKAYVAQTPLAPSVSEDAPRPPPPGAEPTPGPAPTETSERIFRRRLTKAVTSFNLGEFKAMWREDLLEPHMHLFVLLVSAFALGILIWLVEPLLL